MLNHCQIEKLIREQGLITGYLDLGTQLTPNGFDLTAGSIFEFESGGAVDFSNKERVLPDVRELMPQKTGPQDKYGWWQLKKGAYKIKTNETVKLPNSLIGIAFPRSTLLRMGAYTQTGVWDAGFQGKSEFILLVENPLGIRVKQNARIVQLLFMGMDEAVRGYEGMYQDSK
ncbi:MAG: deoxyuridine 5'-triphosphate nucleotidohydrolase [Candidatus Omnitrophica bacterium]|nr:deoxyuridine 5'-triphosphate nucleotidohydrolase [Candidatus Omnitrophota bacterium]